MRIVRYDPQPMTADLVTLERDEDVAVVSLNRPERLNAYGWEMGAALVERMEAVAADPDVRAVVLRGNGRAFCAGLDFTADVRDRIVGRSPAERVRNYYQRFRGSHRRMQFIEDVPQPVVVAIHGYCLGAGLEVALLGDIRLAADGTVFGAPEVAIGVAIDGGLDMRLCEEVGPGWAKWITLTARRFDAAKAREIGLVQEVHAPDALDAAARTLAHEIAAHAPLAVQGTKRVLRYCEGKSVEDGLAFVATWNAAFLDSEDLKEAMRAFFEKRPASFTGR